MTTAIEIAAARIMDCNTDDVKKESYDYYGLDIYSANGQEFAIGLPEDADQAVRRTIRDSLWTFRASYILKHSRVAETKRIEKALEEMQAKLCEECNEIIYAIIEDIDKFTEAAIKDDGRGVFLSSYDSQEREIGINEITFKAYRIN